MKLTIDHNLTPGQLADALTGLALAEGIAEPLTKALSQHTHQREPVREHYLAELMDQMADAGRVLDALMVVNVSRWLAAQPLQKARPSIGPRVLGRRARSAVTTPQKPLRLSQADLEELIALIRSHYRIGIATGTSRAWDIPASLEASWKDRGIILPEAKISNLIGDAFIAGRLAQVLEDGYSLAEMRQLARTFPIPRSASLAMQAVQTRVGFDLSGGPGYRAVQTAGGLLLQTNAQRVQDIVSAYRAGQLEPTPTNRDSAIPEVVEARGDDTRAVQGWRGLARELRTRMGAEDRARDWERFAVSALRMTHAIGALGAMDEEGVESIYYDVHKNACDQCKKLYLNKDGTPKIFPLRTIMADIATNGGTNAGRRTADWQPTALAHPWCQCRPKRVIDGIPPRAR